MRPSWQRQGGSRATGDDPDQASATLVCIIFPRRYYVWKHSMSSLISSMSSRDDIYTCDAVNQRSTQTKEKSLRDIACVTLQTTAIQRAMRPKANPINLHFSATILCVRVHAETHCTARSQRRLYCKCLATCESDFPKTYNSFRQMHL